MSEAITRKEVREMSMREAKEHLLEAAERDMCGSGRGPAHRIPTGETAHKLTVAMAKMHENIYGMDIPSFRYGIYYENGGG